MSVLVSSFNINAIDHVRHFAARSADRVVDLRPRRLRRHDCATARRKGHHALHPFDATVDRDLVDAAHAAGLAVNVWTVDKPDRIAALVDMGVDGICTNVPDVARRVLESKGDVKSR